MPSQAFKAISTGLMCVLLCVTTPASAVEKYKISDYGNGHQIWFEVEDFDERSPAGDQYFPVVDEAGAFGQAITRTGGAGGRIMWTFDISKAGGSAGTWYIWARTINPNNSSDFLIVEGHPGDPVIPEGPPYPGGSSYAEFTTADDRLFDTNMGPPWVWGSGNRGEGDDKVLQDGENTMYIYHRQGNNTVFWDVWVWTDDPDYVPTDEDYINAKVPNRNAASEPSPPVGAIDVPYFTQLTWHAGETAVKHDVYVGTGRADVETASTTNPLDVLVSQAQDPTSLDLGPLEFGQTYYWRVDEANGAPDYTITKGEIWSFTAEPSGIPITQITATASGANAGMEPSKTIDGSGLNALDQHSASSPHMWLTVTAGSWIQYEFDQAYKLHEMLVWNSNQAIETFIGFGVKELILETSLDGISWTPVKSVSSFAQATAVPNYTAKTTVDLSGMTAKFVRITPLSAYGTFGQSGLSEVRFSYIPTTAREPQPGDTASTAGLDVALSWRPGREAASHDLLLSTDKEAVVNGSAVVAKVPEARYAADALDYGTTYYWQVIEVNEAETPVAHASEIWRFTTPSYGLIDDFESYSGEADEEIFMTWWDGYGGDPGLGGATSGYIDAPFVETSVVHTGKQSLPMIYDNDGGFVDIEGNISAPAYSELMREFDSSLDLTLGNASTLALSFRGNAPGFIENADGSITMGAAGADIWDVADEFRFAYKRLSGDGSITARVDSMVDVDPWTKAGVMIRNELTPESTNGFSYASINGRAGVQFRDISGNGTVSTRNDNDGDFTLPFWLRLTRTGNTFTGERSEDGVTWVTMYEEANPAETGSEIIIMNRDVYIGLAVTSHSTGNYTVADISNISLTGNVTGAWQVEAIGVEQPSNDGQDPLYLALEDRSGKSVLLTHPDPAAVQMSTWQDWLIPLSQFNSLRLNSIKSITLGVGYKDGSQSGSEGTLYIDDIRVGKPVGQ